MLNDEQLLIAYLENDLGAPLREQLEHRLVNEPALRDKLSTLENNATDEERNAQTPLEPGNKPAAASDKPSNALQKPQEQWLIVGFAVSIGLVLGLYLSNSRDSVELTDLLQPPPSIATQLTERISGQAIKNPGANFVLLSQFENRQNEKCVIYQQERVQAIACLKDSQWWHQLITTTDHLEANASISPMASFYIENHRGSE